MAARRSHRRRRRPARSSTAKFVAMTVGVVAGDDLVVGLDVRGTWSGRRRRSSVQRRVLGVGRLPAGQRCGAGDRGRIEGRTARRRAGFRTGAGGRGGAPARRWSRGRTGGTCADDQDDRRCGCKESTHTVVLLLERAEPRRGRRAPAVTPRAVRRSVRSAGSVRRQRSCAARIQLCCKSPVAAGVARGSRRGRVVRRAEVRPWRAPAPRSGRSRKARSGSLAVSASAAP